MKFVFGITPTHGSAKIRTVNAAEKKKDAMIVAVNVSYRRKDWRVDVIKRQKLTAQDIEKLAVEIREFLLEHEMFTFRRYQLWLRK